MLGQIFLINILNKIKKLTATDNISRFTRNTIIAAIKITR